MLCSHLQGFWLFQETSEFCHCYGGELLAFYGATKPLTSLQVFGNSNSLPISLVLSLSQTIKGLHWDKVPGDNDDEVAARGILYLLIFQQLGQLVRWTWGYNVLLAPPEKVEGTSENANSRLENGLGGSEEEVEPLMRSSSAEDARDEVNNSGSEETRVDDGMRGNGSASGSQSGQDFPSGEQTPITFRQRSASASTRSSCEGTMKPQAPPDVLPTPTNGNAKPAGHAPSFPSMALDTYNDVPSGLRGLPGRCRTATRNGIKAVSKSIAKASQTAFKVLPIPVQNIFATFGSAIRRLVLGVWSFMNPPLWAMLAAIVVASIPDLQRLLFTDGSFVKNSVSSAIKQSGGVAVPLILVVLGGNLARNTLPQEPGHTKEDDKEETKLLIASLISRMLLPLIIMAPLLAVTAKYVPVSILDDPIFVIVCFLITGAPSALQLAQICQINNVYMGAMSRLLFQSYVVWILPSTLVLVMCALEVVEWAQR